MAVMKWTLCSISGGRLKKWCQYSDRARAEAHAKSNGTDWFVKLYPVNPKRIAKVGGRRSCECLHYVGLPQY